ncbi:hypothetical protein J6590_085567 [Homalodisca vitripennis]|nr:hypothetical protein J6590_085567 [Homalodisca vitripennis]
MEGQLLGAIATAVATWDLGRFFELEIRVTLHTILNHPVPWNKNVKSVLRMWQLKNLCHILCHMSRPPADLAVTWALMELFWTNERAAMAARPRPLHPTPQPPSSLDQ